MRSIVRKALVPSALLVGAATVTAFSLSQVGCSSASGTADPPGPAPSVGATTAPSSTGTVGVALTIPGGDVLNSVSWTITGPNGASTIVQTGTVNVSGSASISFTVGNIPTGRGYTITLTGTTTDGSTTCSGSAQFGISASSTTAVSVLLTCVTTGADAGSALVTASTVNCATWNSVTAVPASTNLGTSVTVAATATSPDPSAVAYAWSVLPAGSGSFANPSAQSTQFTCQTQGTATLTVAMSDSDSGACNPALGTTTVSVNCTGHIDAAQAFTTATKIKHLIVIFGENRSFDNYFGTYPSAQNNPGETAFLAAPGTPVPNNLIQPLNAAAGFSGPADLPNLLTANPTTANAGNGTNAINPFRLAPEFAETSSQNHNYAPEQEAADQGKMDLYPEFTGSAGPPPPADAGAPPATQTKGMVMAYWDGNTMGTYWNFAQQYAINDNAWTTNFGPSSPGAINVISGQTSGVQGTATHPASAFSTSHATPDGIGGFSLIGDIDPLGDTCSSATDQGTMSGQNIGNLLNNAGITWGWFNGGFNLGLTNTNGTTGCGRSTPQTVPFSTTSADYVPHHQPFQFYPSTANLAHTPVSSVQSVGYSFEQPGNTLAEPANHQYDTNDFFNALQAGNLPAVVYLKAPSFEDGHPGNSNPIDEQNFAASVVSALQGAQEWASSAVLITYDDSDGWYDHQAPSIVNMSAGVADFLNAPASPADGGAGLCNSGIQQNGAGPATTTLNGVGSDGGATGPVQGRCGYGTRIPLMVISPFAKKNYVDHTLVDQSSVVRFIEDNWLDGKRIQPGGSFDTIAGSIQNMLTGD